MRRRRISFIMPFIDFAFMVIIIFLGMLSIAVFEAPGEPPQVIRVEPLAPFPENFQKEEKKAKAQKKISEEQEKIKRLEKEVLKLKSRLKEEKREKLQLQPRSFLSQKPLTPVVQEWHAFTDLR